MPDTGSNIIIDISGNTANMATEFASSGSGITNAHVPIQKIAFGDATVSKRVSSTDPLPVTIQSTQVNVGISGDVGITGHAQVITPRFGSEPSTAFGITNNFLKVAGSVTGGLVGVSGYIEGISGGVPVGITGTVTISETTGMPVHGISGQDGVTNNSAAGVFAPILVTGGRGLSQGTDSVTVHGTVGITGGRTILAATDSIKVFGYDGGNQVAATLFTGTGATAGFSGDALKVAVVNTGFTFAVNLSSTVGVTNGSADRAIQVEGLSGGEPLLIKGENGGSVPITASTAVPASVSGTVTIDDTNIVNSLETSTKPVPRDLAAINAQTKPISSIRSDLNSGNIKVRITASDQPGSIVSGSKTTTAVASQLVSKGENVSVGVKVKASIENTDSVLIGNYKLTQNDSAGYPLEPGESCFINVSSPGLIYCRSQSGTQLLHYLGS